MSDDQQISDAPDGAAPTDPAEMMTREHARKLIGQRDTLKHSFDALKFDFDAQAAELEKLRTPTPPTPPTPDGVGQSNSDQPEWAKALDAKIEATQALFTKHQASTAADAVIAEVLKSIPDGNHPTAKALMGTLGVDFTQPGAAADALAKLQTQHAGVLVDHTRGAQPRAPAVKPDGTPDFSAFKTFDEVPDVHKAAAMKDPETFKRLRGQGAGGRAHGLNI